MPAETEASIVAGVSSKEKILIGKPLQSRDADGNWMLTYRYAVEEEEYFAEAPAHASAPPAPEFTNHPDLKCTGVDAQDAGDGHNVIMTVTYTTPTGSVLFVGDTIRSSQAAVIEKAVEELDGITTPEIYAQKALDKRTVPWFTLQYSRRSVETAFVWSESNLIDGVGKIGAPTDLTAPTTGAWLKADKAAQERSPGGDVDLEEKWIYDENLWPVDLYT
jgi:hypothetical protein